MHLSRNCPLSNNPVQWSLAAPSALESKSRPNQGSVVADPICKSRCHKAGHLQVRVAVGRRSTCVSKEAPLNEGPSGQVGMNGDTFSIKAPKECSKKFAATFKGKFLTRGNVLRIFFLFLEDFGAPL